MNAFANLWLPVLTLCATVILGVFYQTHHFDKRFEDLKDSLNHRFDSLEARVDKLEQRFDHPVYRP